MQRLYQGAERQTPPPAALFTLAMHFLSTFARPWQPTVIRIGESVVTLQHPAYRPSDLPPQMRRGPAGPCRNWVAGVISRWLSLSLLCHSFDRLALRGDRLRRAAGTTRSRVISMSSLTRYSRALTGELLTEPGIIPSATTSLGSLSFVASIRRRCEQPSSDPCLSRWWRRTTLPSQGQSQWLCQSVPAVAVIEQPLWKACLNSVDVVSMSARTVA
jgi:hypothetical protein